jgi:hypothetical protein
MVLRFGLAPRGRHPATRTVILKARSGQFCFGIASHEVAPRASSTACPAAIARKFATYVSRFPGPVGTGEDRETAPRVSTASFVLTTFQTSEEPGTGKSSSSVTRTVSPTLTWTLRPASACPRTTVPPAAGVAGVPHAHSIANAIVVRVTFVSRTTIIMWRSTETFPERRCRTRTSSAWEGILDQLNHRYVLKPPQFYTWRVRKYPRPTDAFYEYVPVIVVVAPPVTTADWQAGVFAKLPATPKHTW